MGMEVVVGLLRPACCWVPGCCQDPSSVPCVGPNQPETEQVGVSVQPPWVLPLSLLPSVPPAGCSALGLLCQPACVPLCTRVHVCACVQPCACVSISSHVHHAPLHIPVHRVHCVHALSLCIPVHPCASLCSLCMPCPCASMCTTCLWPSPPAASAAPPPWPGVGLGAGDGSRRQPPADPFQMWLSGARLRAASSPRPT